MAKAAEMYTNDDLNDQPGSPRSVASKCELVRRDSGNWSGDRNSASSSSSTSLENPYQYFVGKIQNRYVEFIMVKKQFFTYQNVIKLLTGLEMVLAVFLEAPTNQKSIQ